LSPDTGPRVDVDGDAERAPITAWVYVAGPLLAAEIGAASEVTDGDWSPWLVGG